MILYCYDFATSENANILQSRLLGRSRVGVINGGVKPVNNLGQPKPFVPLKRKAFNLSTNLPIPSQLRNKRQRTNGRASESTTSSNELIDLDSPPPQHRPSTKKSVLSKSRPTQSNNGDISSVDEYSNVEKQINPSRRSESTASRHFRLPSSKQSANPHEDDTDPIIDVDMPSHQPSGKGLQKSYLPDKPYSGTAKRDDSRPRPSFWGTHSDSSKPKVLPSHLDDLEKKPSSNSAKRKHESAGSMDELAVGHDSKKKTTKKESPEKTRADELLKAALAGVNGAEKFVYLDDTDDEKVAKKIDLAPSVSKKLKNPAKKPGEITLQVKEAFSNVATFKTTPGDRWLFVCNIDEEVCRIFDGDGKLKDEVFTKSIRAIDSSEDSAKMVLHRLADGNTKRASDTYLELGSNNESADLVEQLRKLNSTLTRTFPTAVQINKVFSFNRDRLFQQKPTRQNPPEDLQLIEKNAETRQIQKRAEELKRAGNGRAQNGAVQSQRSEGRARRMANSVTGDTIAPNKFYNQSSDRGADPSPPPPTRSSARIQKKEPVYQERPRSPTPIPVVKWTELHPHWNDLWLDTVVYPPGPGHKRTATVDRGDIPRLDEEEFLNDSLVNFYLRYLEHDLEQKRPEVAKRIYFQNSFFYERLTKPAAGGKKGIDYAAVQRWTKGVDLFSKDYIIVPVCENIHWYVAIICNAPKLLKPDVVEDAVEAKTPTKTNTDLKEDAPASHSSPGNPEDNGDPMKMESLQNSLEECMEHEKLAVESPESRRTVQESNDQHETNPPDSHPIANIVSDLEPKTAENSAKAKPTRKAPMDRSLDPNAPRIIILDSLGGGHPVTSKNLRDYLVAEMKDKHGKEISPPRQMHFPAKNLEGQQNYSDCGLFLLSYIQKFLESPESFISSILGNEGKPSWVQPKKMRQDIRNHLFKLQPQSPKKKKRPPKPSDDARAVPSRPASRDASGATRAGTQNQTEHFPPPPRKPSEKKNAPNGVALAPTNASTNTTHNSKSAPRLFNPAAPAEALAKMPNSTVSRSHKESNLAAAQEVVEVANGTGSERISNQKPIVSESSNSKWRTNSNPNVTDEDNSSRLQELTGSSQVVPHSLTRKKSEAESRVSKLFRAMGDSVNGFMGRGQDAVDKGDVSKGLGNSESYPLAIDDSPAKPARGGYDSEQKRPSRRQSSESVEVISSRARSSRKKSRPGQPRDSPSRYERENVGSDEVLEPPSPGLRNPDLGDMAGQASEPTLATTEQKNGNKSPVGLNENDEDEMLIHATNACVSGTSAPKADSSTMEKNPRQISSSPPRDRSPALSFKFIIKEDEDEDSSAQQSPPSPTAGRSFSQQSLTTYGKHTRWDADEGEIASM